MPPDGKRVYLADIVGRARSQRPPLAHWLQLPSSFRFHPTHLPQRNAGKQGTSNHEARQPNYQHRLEPAGPRTDHHVVYYGSQAYFNQQNLSNNCSPPNNASPGTTVSRTETPTREIRLQAFSPIDVTPMLTNT